jgi:ribosome recycling factor
MVDDVISDLKQNIDKSMEGLKRELSKVRTGRANASLLDGIRVEYYGTSTPLNQVASVQVPDPRLITVKPWEKSMIPVIEKAIKASDLGLNPQSDGEIVRIPIPPLTQERRKDLAKQVKRIAEESKVGLRTHRREANELLQSLLDDKDITEDDLTRGKKKVQDATDEGVSKIDEIAGKKEKEILDV